MIKEAFFVNLLYIVLCENVFHIKTHIYKTNNWNLYKNLFESLRKIFFELLY